VANFDRGQELLQRALDFAEAGHYTQVKARCLNGLAEICRYQARFEAALNHHQAAIALLDAMGARCDLAEAELQLGLTYLAAGNTGAGQNSLEQALQHFTEMQTPRQVEKILQLVHRLQAGSSFGCRIELHRSP
jgi:tetratricopeptide (TPR) repeat protein